MYDQQPPIKTGLLDFLRKSIGSQFVIPVYQRNYTWTANKEVKQYFEDYEYILSGKYPKHFLGILIYLDSPINAFSREFSVIDGQQRLTTTFLILYALKKLMIEAGEEDSAKALDAQCLTNQFVDDKLKFKLKPLIADDQVYQHIVNDDFDSASEKNSNVYKNYVWIKERLAKLHTKYSFDEMLNGLDKLYVVCVPVAKTDSPQKIFESINSTGAKLFTSDLIRNYLLMDIASDIQEKYYNTYWRKLEEYLTNDSKKLEAFFRLFLACKTKTLSNTPAVYSDFKNWYIGEIANGSNIEEILKTLVRYAKYHYNIYKKPLEDIDVRIRPALEDFRNILSDMPAPFFMELYSIVELRDEEGNDVVSFEQFSNIIEIVNIYLIRRATNMYGIKKPANGGGQTYIQAAGYTREELDEMFSDANDIFDTPEFWDTAAIFPRKRYTFNATVVGSTQSADIELAPRTGRKDYRISRQNLKYRHPAWQLENGFPEPNRNSSGEYVYEKNYPNIIDNLFILIIKTICEDGSVRFYATYVDSDDLPATWPLGVGLEDIFSKGKRQGIIFYVEQYLRFINDKNSPFAIGSAADIEIGNVVLPANFNDTSDDAVEYATKEISLTVDVSKVTITKVEAPRLKKKKPHSEKRTVAKDINYARRHKNLKKSAISGNFWQLRWKEQD